MQHTGAIGIYGPVLRDLGGQWGREAFNMGLYINKNLVINHTSAKCYEEECELGSGGVGGGAGKDCRKVAEGRKL